MSFLSFGSFLAGCGLCVPLPVRVKEALTKPKAIGLDPALCKALLQEQEVLSSSVDAEEKQLGDGGDRLKLLFKSCFDPHHNDEDDKSSDGLPFRGVPNRPLYLEIARRLEIWTDRQVNQHANLLTPVQTTNDETNSYSGSSPFVPASALKFSELDRPPLPIMTTNNIHDWFQQAGNDGVLHLLGMRKTIGTPSEQWLLPPSRDQLMQAANQIHKAKLTVAARARAKHAHRGGEASFFGVAKGGAELQNEAAAKLVLQLLREAIWINIHTFGGMDERAPVLEIRVASGYGARWTADWYYEEDEKEGHGDDDLSPKSLAKTRVAPTKAVFRGFLEPQMENGFELKWRHD